MILDKKTIELGEGVFLDVDPKSEYINLRMDHSKGKLIKKVDLWAACFAIADGKTQEALMPVRQTEMVTFERVHHVKLKKDVREGTMLNFKCKVSVPQVVTEGLAGSLTKKRSKILMPLRG